jgi:hypothetical protein
MDGATGWLSASAFEGMHVPGSVRARGNVSLGGTLLALLVRTLLARPPASSGSPADLAQPRALRRWVSPTWTLGRHCGLSVYRSIAGGVILRGVQEERSPLALCLYEHCISYVLLARFLSTACTRIQSTGAWRIALARRSASCLSIFSTPLGLVPLCSTLALNRVLAAATLSEPRSSHLMAPWESPDPPRRYANYTPKCTLRDAGHPQDFTPGAKTASLT